MRNDSLVSSSRVIQYGEPLFASSSLEYAAIDPVVHHTYMSEPQLRAKVRRGLHALARAVYYGQRGRISAREVYDQVNACSCLTLILACIVYWGQAREIMTLRRLTRDAATSAGRTARRPRWANAHLLTTRPEVVAGDREETWPMGNREAVG